MATKNIILCSDGTGNAGGKGHGTNVWRLYNAVDIHAHRHNGRCNPADIDGAEIAVGQDTHPLAAEQVAYYDDGVGTERLRVFRVLFGAVGFGLGRKVRRLYVRLARNYEPGDHIYLYGFSRGAFTVRTLCGMITECGVLDRHCEDIKSDKDLKRHARKAYRAYRYKYEAWFTKPINYLSRKLERLLTADEFRAKYAVKVHENSYLRSDYALIPRAVAMQRNGEPVDHDPDYLKLDHDKRVPIRFMGVWDTVDAVGLPSDWLTSLINTVFYRFKFDRRTLSPWVNKACHALAIDEQRRSFAPLLFDETHAHKEGVNDQPKDPLCGADDRIEQVWFAGVHSNVGGGYPKQQLAKVSQHWMMRKSELAGLKFLDEDVDSTLAQSNAHGKIYDSRSGWGIYYICKPRDVTSLSAANSVKKARIHVSVYKRIALGTDNYAPGNLPADVDIDTTETDNVGEDPQSLHGLAQQLQQGHAAKPAMMLQLNNYDRFSRALHWAFYPVTAYALLCTQPQVATKLESFTGISLTSICPSLSVPGASAVFGNLSPLMHLSLVVGGLGFVMYVIDSMIRRRYDNRFSHLWRELGPMKNPWWRLHTNDSIVGS